MDNFALETGKLDSFYTIPMILTCPSCGERHIDEQDFVEVPHHTHACQGCGMVWRPAKVNTHGVRFLPGYANTDKLPSGVAEALGPEVGLLPCPFCGRPAERVEYTDYSESVATMRRVGFRCSNHSDVIGIEGPVADEAATLLEWNTRTRPIGNDITDEWLADAWARLFEA